MSTVSPTAAYISNLQYIQGQITFYMSLVIILFGIVGNTLNCLVFGHKSLRTKPCVLYFLIASILNIIIIFSGVAPRALQSFFMIPDQTETNPVLCKMRLITLFTMRTISSWLLTLATVDRYLISSPVPTRRQMSNLKNAWKCIIVVSILSAMFWAEAGYCFEANMVGTPQKCYAKSDSCRIFNDLSQALVTTVIPALVMLIVGLMTIRNIQKISHVGPASITMTHTTGQKAIRSRREERSLTVMLIAQVIILTIFTLPQAGQKLYLTYTFYEQKASTQRVLEGLLFQFVLLLTYGPSCVTFYLFTITGSLFRETLLRLLKASIQRLNFCH